MVNVKEELSWDIFVSPWGWVGALFSVRGLRRLALPHTSRAAVVADLDIPPGAAPAPWEELRRGLASFFQGSGECPSVPVDLAGLSGFPRRVLAVAHAIPRGETISYSEAARRAGSPRACRAAGQALARNPVPLVIPCHRVVGVAGPGGYAGGVEMKSRLLALESGAGGCAVRRS